jgi:hypothetical protein
VTLCILVNEYQLFGGISFFRLGRTGILSHLGAHKVLYKLFNFRSWFMFFLCMYAQYVEIHLRYVLMKAKLF